MNLTRTLLAPALLVALSLAAPAQDVGSSIGTLELSDFAQTEAKSYDDFVGRAVLLEFFAYW